MARAFLALAVRRWKARARLVVLGAACIAGGLIVPFVSLEMGRNILASGLVLGGVAMLIVAMTGLDDGRDD